jgi:hypothetical protein
MPAPTIDQLELADDAAHWAALGFDVHEDVCQIGAVRLRFAGAVTAPPSGSTGIVRWSLRDATTADLDGLPTAISARPLPADAPVHPNGIRAIDHVVAVSPNLDRSVPLFRAAGLDLRRIREQPTPAGAPRQAFFRLGETILELIQAPQEALARMGGPDAPVRFWGLALIAEDLDATVARLTGHVSEARSAVQPGRRIATVRRSAGLAVPLALMDV